MDHKHFFYGDHTAQIHPRVLAAFVAANNESPHARSYLRDAHTASLTNAYSALFGLSPGDARIYPLVNGTSANATSLASLLTARPEGGIVYCAQQSHIGTYENGAPETLSHGRIKLEGVPDGIRPIGGNKIDASLLDELVTSSRKGSKHLSPLALSISFPTESGELYTRDELRALRAVASKHDLLLHIDGARLAVGLVASGMSAHELYDIARPDVLTFGQMKNGGFCEGVMLFNPTLAKGFERVLTAGAHMITRARPFSASMNAYIEQGLWLDNAKASIDAAQHLQSELARAIDKGRLPGITLLPPSPTNRASIKAEASLLKHLDSADICLFYRGGDTARLMTSYNTTPSDCDALIDRMSELAKDYTKAEPNNAVDGRSIQQQAARKGRTR